MCRVEIILIVFFLWSLFILFFLFGEKDSMEYLFRGTKKTIVQKVAAFERKKKLDSFFVRFIKPLPPVVLFKKDDDFDDDDNALSV